MSDSNVFSLADKPEIGKMSEELLALIPRSEVVASVHSNFETVEDQRAQLFSLVFDYTADVTGDPEVLTEARDVVFETLWVSIVADAQ
jgi:hypothetical protein